MTARGVVSSVGRCDVDESHDRKESERDQFLSDSRRKLNFYGRSGSGSEIHRATIDTIQKPRLSNPGANN